MNARPISFRKARRLLMGWRGFDFLCPQVSNGEACLRRNCRDFLVDATYDGLTRTERKAFLYLNGFPPDALLIRPVTNPEEN